MGLRIETSAFLEGYVALGVPALTRWHCHGPRVACSPALTSLSGRRCGSFLPETRLEAGRSRGARVLAGSTPASPTLCCSCFGSGSGCEPDLGVRFPAATQLSLVNAIVEPTGYGIALRSRRAHVSCCSALSERRKPRSRTDLSER